ncbi:MAG: tetratricopeptide repeat protein, partial [Rubripirellula sp.]
VLARAKANDLKKLDVKTVTMGMAIATEAGQQDEWMNLASHLASIDQTGKGVSDLLSLLIEQGKPDAAERLAASLISPASDEAVSTAAREAACRWAGRTQRWSMLSMASESELKKIESPSATRSATVEKLFAESLMQTGQVEQAAQWWNHLVDGRQASDFATLLRCAEAETSVGKDANLAGQRIALARSAAGGDAFNETLVDLLAAELAVRKSRFEEARALLESVVRAVEVDATLRGRAQWLIGETHYLQAQFTEAIEAYRRVEGIDPGGSWVSASLVQAGKSFEQLGRTREAAVCYGSLIGRFADSPHAQVARQRMASIDPANSSSPSPIRR